MEPIPGHCTPASHPAGLELTARALQRDVETSALISHSTAAELIRLPLPAALTFAETQTLHVTLPLAARRRLGPRVRVHTGEPLASARTNGIWIVGPVDLLMGLAGLLSPLELVMACDALVGPDRSAPRLSLESLRTLVAGVEDRPGIARVRRAVASARERVESPKETELRLLLLEHGFAEPLINRQVTAPGSGQRFRLDLAYGEERIAIEYDGDWHRTDRDRWRRDRRKDDVLHELGWRVVRVTGSDLTDPAGLLARLHHLGAPRRRRGRVIASAASMSNPRRLAP